MNSATATHRHANKGQGMVEFGGALVMASLSVVSFGAVGGWATGQMIINHTMETVNALLIMAS